MERLCAPSSGDNEMSADEAAHSQTIVTVRGQSRAEERSSSSQQ